jgi:hypothetical protein
MEGMVLDEIDLELEMAGALASNPILKFAHI